MRRLDTRDSDSGPAARGSVATGPSEQASSGQQQGAEITGSTVILNGRSLRHLLIVIGGPA
jgi:hypothetical protein